MRQLAASYRLIVGAERAADADTFAVDEHREAGDPAGLAPNELAAARPSSHALLLSVISQISRVTSFNLRVERDGVPPQPKRVARSFIGSSNPMTRA